MINALTKNLFKKLKKLCEKLEKKIVENFFNFLFVFNFLKTNVVRSFAFKDKCCRICLFHYISRVSIFLHYIAHKKNYSKLKKKMFFFLFFF